MPHNFPYPLSVWCLKTYIFRIIIRKIYYYSTFPGNRAANPPFFKCLLLVEERIQMRLKGLGERDQELSLTHQRWILHFPDRENFSIELNKTNTNLIFIRASCYTLNLPKSWEYPEDLLTNWPLIPQTQFCRHST